MDKMTVDLDIPHSAKERVEATSTHVASVVLSKHSRASGPGLGTGATSTSAVVSTARWTDRSQWDRRHSLSL
jgi:hypothetical protein